MSDQHDHLVRIFRRRYPWLWERAADDLVQTVALGILLATEDAQRSVSSQVEALAHALGWHRAKRRHNGRTRRVWLDEPDWLRRAAEEPAARVGAPAGNQNASGHRGRNQHTKEKS